MTESAQCTDAMKIKRLSLSMTTVHVEQPLALPGSAYNFLQIGITMCKIYASLFMYRSKYLVYSSNFIMYSQSCMLYSECCIVQACAGLCRLVQACAGL